MIFNDVRCSSDFTDVLFLAGFTNLCEKFGLNAKYGTDKLTKTLSTYMGSLVQEILKYEGDVLKYAGTLIKKLQ